MRKKMLEDFLEDFKLLLKCTSFELFQRYLLCMKITKIVYFFIVYTFSDSLLISLQSTFEGKIDIFEKNRLQNEKHVNRKNEKNKKTIKKFNLLKLFLVSIRTFLSPISSNKLTSGQSYERK